MTFPAYQTLLLLPQPTALQPLCDALAPQLEACGAQVTPCSGGLNVTFGTYHFELRLHPGRPLAGEHGAVATVLGLNPFGPDFPQRLTVGGADDPEGLNLRAYFTLTRTLRGCLPDAVFLPGPPPRALQA